MTHLFDEAVIRAVLAHMNGDHADDNLLIMRAFSPYPDVIGAVMTGLDGAAGEWRVQVAQGEEFAVRVPWPSGPITERAEVRREVVALYDEACRRQGVEARPHE